MTTKPEVSHTPTPVIRISGLVFRLGMTAPDATYVFRAVNAHEDLVDALKRILHQSFKHETQYWLDASGTDKERLGVIVELARNAIAKAEGGHHA